MRYQRGYINLDGLVPFLLFCGALIGIVIAYVVPWLWSFVKPWIHAVTG